MATPDTLPGNGPPPRVPAPNPSEPPPDPPQPAVEELDEEDD